MNVFDLKLFRKSIAKLSQEEFAKKIGFSKGTVGKIEAGYAPVTDNMLNKIEDNFKLDLSQYKSYAPYHYNKENTKAELIPEDDLTQYHLQFSNLVDLLRDYSTKLELAQREKEALLLRISELEKQLLLAPKK